LMFFGLSFPELIALCLSCWKDIYWSFMNKSFIICLLSNCFLSRHYLILGKCNYFILFYYYML
jgi:hypothetical protein